MRPLVIGIGLLCVGCAALAPPESRAPLSAADQYQAWRKERGLPDRPTEGGQSSLGEFRFFYVSGHRGQPIDRLAISPKTMLNSGGPADWRSLLRSGDAIDVQSWVGWLDDMVDVAPADIDARQPPLVAHYTPPTLRTEGDTTHFQGWFVEYPSGSFVRLTIVASSDNASEFTYESLEKLSGATP